MKGIECGIIYRLHYPGYCPFLGGIAIAEGWTVCRETRPGPPGPGPGAGPPDPGSIRPGSRPTMQSPNRQYKAPADYTNPKTVYKTSKKHATPKDVRQEPKTLSKSSNKYLFNIKY